MLAFSGDIYGTSDTVRYQVALSKTRGDSSNDLLKFENAESTKPLMSRNNQRRSYVSEQLAFNTHRNNRHWFKQ